MAQMSKLPFIDLFFFLMSVFMGLIVVTWFENLDTIVDSQNKFYLGSFIWDF